jgi:hypothetical protein
MVRKWHFCDVAADNEYVRLLGTRSSVQTAKGGTESIKLANDAGLFLVTKADMSAIQSGKFVGITSVEQGGKRVAREVHVFDDSLRGLGGGTIPGILNPSRT